MAENKEAFETKVELSRYFAIVNRVLQIQENRIKALEAKNGMAYVEKTGKFKVPSDTHNGGRPEVCVKEGSNKVPSATCSGKRRNGNGSDTPA